MAHRLRPIGLDIGHSTIKMLQCAVNGARVSVIGADKVRFTPEINGDPQRRREFTVTTIREMLKRGRFHGNNVVSCLPNEVLRVKSLRVDARGEEVDYILDAEIAEHAGLDPQRDQISYVVAGDVHQGEEVKSELILFAVDADVVKSHIELLEQAGLKPVGIDTVPCSLFRSFQRSLRRQEDRGLVSVFVDIGSSFTTVVVGRGREISFVKQIPIGSERFNEEISRQLGVGTCEAAVLRSRVADGALASEVDTRTRQTILDCTCSVAEELAREISICFKYYAVTFRGKRPSRAVFAGGGAYDGTLLAEFRKNLGVEVEVAEPLKGFDLTRVHFDTDRRELLCEWAVAVGLTLKGWETGDDGAEDYERS